MYIHCDANKIEWKQEKEKLIQRTDNSIRLCNNNNNNNNNTSTTTSFLPVGEGFPSFMFSTWHKRKTCVLAHMTEM